MEKQTKRQIAYRNFYGENKHIYEDELGWYGANFLEADSHNSADVLKYYLSCNFNIAFFCVADGEFYALHREVIPMEVKRLHRDETQKYRYEQAECDSHEDGEILYLFDEDVPVDEIINTIQIAGMPLSEAILRSEIFQIS